MSSARPPRGAHELLPMGDDVIIDDPEDAFDLELVPREGERRPLQPNDSLEVDEGEEELDLEEPIDLPPEPSAKMACLRQYGPVWAAVFIIMAFVLVLAFGLGDFTPRTGSAANEETPAVVVSDVAITKSASDTRSYRYLHLAQNSLPVMLIHDPSTEKAAAAMSVGAGSSDDFPQREGLAHFLEHALFMGSAKFPDENAYSSYLQSHGGSSNAYTSEEETNFFFDVQSSEGILAGILPRFAGFFTAPTLSASGAAREMHAVDNEHTKNIHTDEWRNYALLHNVADVRSSFHHFGTGTIATLNHTGIEKDLAKFWQQHYTADNMKLVVLGKETLDELESLVATYFSEVPGEPLQKECIDSSSSGGNSSACDAVDIPVESPLTDPSVNHFLPFTREQTMVNVSWLPSTSPSHRMHLYFPLPSNKVPLRDQFVLDPISYLSYLIGHEGANDTLCSSLKSSNLAESVSVGLVVDSRTVDQSLFGIEIKLTELGNTYQNRDLILERVFEYVDQLRRLPLRHDASQPSVASHESYYATMSAESRVRFEFKQKESPIDYTSTIASRMNSYMPFGVGVEQILMPPSVHQFGDGASIPPTIEYLTVENLVLLWSSSDLNDADVAEQVAPPEEWQTEPWYGIPYVVQPISAKFASSVAKAVIEAAKAPTSLMHLPPMTNDFLPTDFDVIDWQAMRDAAEAEVKAGSSSHVAADRLAAEWSIFNPDADVPISVPLLNGDSSSSSNTLFYKPDLRFGLPYAYVSTLIRVSPGFLRGLTPAAIDRQVQFQLWRACLAEVLTPMQYQLSLVGYSLSVQSHSSRIGFVVSLSGFSSGLLTVWRRLLPKLTDFSTIESTRFDVLKHAVYQNTYATWSTDAQPYEHARYYMRVWEEATKPTMEELDQAFNTTILATAYDKTKLTAFVDQMLLNTGTTSYVYGNANVSLARAFYDAFVEVMSKPGRSLELTADDRKKIAAGNKAAVFHYADHSSDEDDATPSHASYAYRRTVLNPDDPNSSLIYNLEVSTSGSTEAELRSALLLMLVHQLMSNQVFNTLRTQEALGYIVASRMRESIGVGDAIVRGYEFIIQSGTFDPSHIEQRVENFLVAFNGTLAALTADEFALQTSTLTFTLEQSLRPTLSMAANFDAVWAGKIVRDVDTTTFTREQTEIELLKTITKQDVCDFFQSKFLSLASRRKFVIALFAARFDQAQTLAQAIDASDADIAQRLESDVELNDAQRHARAAAPLAWGFTE